MTRLDAAVALKGCAVHYESAENGYLPLLHFNSLLLNVLFKQMVNKNMKE